MSKGTFIFALLRKTLFEERILKFKFAHDNRLNYEDVTNNLTYLDDRKK